MLFKRFINDEKDTAMREKPLNQKIALVTGASRGIGLCIAKALHKAGLTVGITGRNNDSLTTAAGHIGERCKPYVCDQRDPAAIRGMAKAVLEEMGTPDVLVNNAGVYRGGMVQSMSLDRWNEIIETNLTGVFLTTQAFLPAMIQQGRGDIVMISSMSGKKGDPGTSAYNASKFGLQGFSQALIYEVRKDNIRVMVLNPSSVNTSDEPSEEWGPGLYLHADDIAQTVVHLISLPGRTLIRDMDIWGTNP